MKREVRTLIVIGVAILVGGIAALFVARQARQVPVREVEVGKATMVIAAFDLPLGTKLSRDNVKAVPWPSTTPIVGSFSSVDQVVDRGVIAHVVANEPLTESKLAPTQAGTGLPPAIPKGMRAVSIKVNDVIGVAGFVVPGTRVDVLATVSDEGGQKDPMSRVVLSDVTVLTSGTRYDQEAAKKDGKPIPATVVTLMVTPQDAERVALASEKSKLMLALRNPLDLDPTETTGIRMAALMRSGAPESPKPAPHRAAPPPPPPPPPPPVAAAPSRYTVEAIKGMKRTEEVLH